MESFESLQVWQESRKLRIIITSLTKNFPRDEKYRLVDQLLRACRSVTANLAEGFGRSNYRENIQFCRIARGSLSETLDHLICAYDCNYFDKETYSAIRKQIFICWRLLNGYISYLKSASIRKK